MPITVKFFASLRERIGRADAVVEWSGPTTVADVWARATDGAALPPNTLVAVNMEYADSAQLVHENDEVAFFPPVTGGDDDG
jgi:sulfur-carrier protein